MNQNNTVQEIVEEYRQFCRDNVYVCAYCDHCLEEVEIVQFFKEAMDRAYTAGMEAVKMDIRRQKDGFSIREFIEFRANSRGGDWIKALEVIDNILTNKEK